MEELETLPEGVSPEHETPQPETSVAEEPADHPAESSAAPEDAAVASIEAEPGVLEPDTNELAESVEPAVSEAPTAEIGAAVEGADIASPVPGPSVSMDELMAPDEPSVEEPAQMPVADSQLRAVLEAIVYVAEEPLTLAQISSALQQSVERVRDLLDQLVAEFDKPEHGLTIREVAGGYKMATKAEHHEAVRTFVKSLKPPLKLSLPALETLAVIAYKQPVTSPEIMEIRGVRGAGVLNTLLDRKLIAAAGRKNVIGKPILYKTTKEFLIQFGLKDLSELPSLKEFEEIRRMAFADSEVALESPMEPTREAKEALNPAAAPSADAEVAATADTPSESTTVVGDHPFETAATTESDAPAESVPSEAASPSEPEAGATEQEN